MKKTGWWSRILNVILCLCMVLSIVPVIPLTVEATNEIGLSVGDTFYLGYYPQKEIKDNSLIETLNKQQANWGSYHYYSSAGIQSDYMMYKDVVYNGERYRAVKFSEYRPSSSQKANSYFVNEVYWFKFEPIKWILLNTETGYSVCDQVIDSQAYHHTSASSNGYYANNYEKSDIRNWLINDFYHTAFSDMHKSYIRETDLDNSAWSSKYSSASTKDKVFLLSRTELNALSNSCRDARATDYARVQGCPISNSNYARYLSLRTAGGVSYGICYYTYGESGCYGYNNKDDAIFVLHGTRPGIYLNLDRYQEDFKREDGFNFYMNHASTNISVGMSVKLHIGYYTDNVVDSSVTNYIYTNSDNAVLKVEGDGWSDRYGQKLTLTALQEGSSVITVTHPDTGENASLEIHVSPRESVWNFYNIPKLNIEGGKITNFYNYSDMVVDEFGYTEHKNKEGELDYYTVTMTVWNSSNLYGAVTSHYPDGALYEYQIIDKKDVLDTSFVSSLQSVYYSFGDLFYLFRNEQYYSGKSITTENQIEINVPVGGKLLISNNAAASEVVSTINYAAYALDVYNIIMSTKGLVDDMPTSDVKQIVISDVVKQLIEDGSDNVLKCFQDAILDSFKHMDLHGDNIQETVLRVAQDVLTDTGINFLEKIEEEICSVKGVASLGEDIMTAFLPTGAIIDALYTHNEALEMYAFQRAYYNSVNRPTGIAIYAPTDSTKLVSNGIDIDTQENTTEIVLHAYTLTDTGTAGIDENSFIDQSVYHADRFTTYNITLYKNGTETQPQSMVTVRIPIPASMNKLNRNKFKVYRNNKDGTLTDMNAWVEGEYMVFETDHFSYYSIVDESASVVDAELRFSDASLTLYDNLCVSYKVSQTLLTEGNYEKPYIRFVMNGVETIVKDYHIFDGKLVFDFEDIAPNQMSDTIYATLYAIRDGVVYQSAVKEYSITDYCYSMLDKCSSDEYGELRTLLVDILHYGSATQIFTNYHTDALADAALSEQQLAWGTVDAPVIMDMLDREYVAVDSPKVIWKGAGLNLRESIAMRFKIEAGNAEDLSVKITDDEGTSWVIYGDQFEATEGGYYVFFDGLNAGQMSKTVYLTVYDGFIPVSNTLRYSIESYAYAKQNSNDAKLAELVKAMTRYGNSAKAYVEQS